MKKTFYIFILISFSRQLLGQTNLVPNPSFEQYSQCPTNQGQVSFANGWGEYASADYFNSCSSVPNFSVPINWSGNHPAASGNAYCALATFGRYWPNGREFIFTSLTTTLNIGTKYYLSFKTCAGISSQLWTYMTSNKIGALLTVGNHTAPVVVNRAHVYAPNIINDTINWTKVFGSFKADSTYKFITLGNFFDDVNTSTMTIVPCFTCGAYYLIDDVCLSTDSLFAFNYNSVGLQENRTENNISIHPNPANSLLNIDNNSTSIILFSLFNNLGSKLTEIQVKDKATINLIDYPAGIYFIKLTTDKSIVTKKIIIDH